MKLHTTPQACSLAVDIVARELGIALDLVWVDVRARNLKDGSSFLHIHPKGQVPVLQTDDGQWLAEGSVIVQYLADSHAESGLLPSSPCMARYRVLEWLSSFSSEPHESFTPLFRPTTPDAYRVIATENIRKRLAGLNQVPSERPNLHGGAFTAADAYCYTIVMWSRLHRIELGDWPQLSAHLERIAERPSMQAAENADKAESSARSASAS